MVKRFLPLLTFVSLIAAAYAGPESLPSSDKDTKQVIQEPAPPEAWSWTGFYIGGRAGYGWNTGEATSDPLPSAAGYAGGGPLSGEQPYRRTPDADGFVGGGEVGFNLQLNRFVIGLETDFSGSSMDGSSSVTPLGTYLPGSWGPGSYLHLAHDVEWFGTARGRLGFTIVPRLLIYGTGGLAYAHSTSSGDAYDSVTFHYASHEGTNLGWTGGGGLEYLICHHWSIKAEYLYIDCGSQSAHQFEVVNNRFPVGNSYNWHDQFQTVSFGLNFKF